MNAQNIAQGLAGLGRGKDTMLMHVTPNEVSGLQQLAMAQGGSLTINPETGLPEAGFFDDIFSTVAPIAVGALGASFGLGPLGAGLLAGGAAYALTGDPMKALTSGLGGAGGASLYGKVGKYGLTPEVAKITPVADAGVNAFTQNAGNLASGAGASAGQVGMANSFNMATGQPMNAIANVGATSSKVPGAFASNFAEPAARTVTNATQNMVPNAAQGAKNFFGMGEAGKNPYDFFKTGPGEFSDAMTMGAPLLAAASAPQQLNAPVDDSYQMKYEGPYVPQEREMRLPSLEEQQQMRTQGSPEFSYFKNSNPIPGFRPAFANGGTIQAGGLQDLYGSRDDNMTGPALSRDGYGLGRLNSMAEGGMAYAAGGPVSFDDGGTIPLVGGPGMNQAVANSYAVAPTDLAAVARLGETAKPAAEEIFSNPMGFLNPMFGLNSSQLGTITNAGGVDDKNRTFINMMGMAPQFGFGGGMNSLRRQPLTPTPIKPTMQDYIDAARRTYMPEQSMATINTPGAPEMLQFTNVNPVEVKKAVGGGLKNGGFVVPADVVSHLGNGSTDAGLALLQKQYGAKPIKGAGDGMSDSIKTTIDGKQPARIADGEAFISPEQVKRNGGAKKFYAMMDKVRTSRTGTKKQGKQINPNKFLPA